MLIILHLIGFDRFFTSLYPKSVDLLDLLFLLEILYLQQGAALGCRVTAAKQQKLAGHLCRGAQTCLGRNLIFLP